MLWWRQIALTRWHLAPRPAHITSGTTVGYVCLVGSTMPRADVFARWPSFLESRLPDIIWSVTTQADQWANGVSKQNVAETLLRTMCSVWGQAALSVFTSCPGIVPHWAALDHSALRQGILLPVAVCTALLH
jgi:hypothetical protein